MILLQLLIACSWLVDCPGGVVTDAHRPWNPPLDADGQLCRVSERSITVDYPAIALREVQQRYHMHYSNHDWSVDARATSLVLTQQALTVDVSFEARGEDVRVVVERR